MNTDQKNLADACGDRLVDHIREILAIGCEADELGGIQGIVDAEIQHEMVWIACKHCRKTGESLRGGVSGNP